ncbi:acid phosphatase [Erwinia psidii]|uniref:acid phosphatase n=1 Tax=Erwinia psidii TaxID=69224 RepID=A0A3N6SI82_9GAMM|nr:phosphatase PAP2 family protein [Erwinia psidii]MCX8957858.1 phosphatase PAP2 family protein [Erwinia psidii]MCX8960909.1 phosphatase PAP2 family protein [Erwinia psidii]RQM38471.1 phosphatase PAP2 family protein [Erwinia psidii]
MRIRYTLLTATLLVSQLAQAKTTDLSEEHLRAILDSTTPASTDTQFVALDSAIQQSLIAALQGDADKLTRDQLKDAEQSDKLADNKWLKASGYDFAKKEKQQASISLLSAFPLLPKTTIDASLKTVEQVNLNASQGLRSQALIDAEGQDHLFFLADALGPKLGQAFIRAYNNGELGKAAALIKASEVGTGTAKKHFNNPRPFLIPGNTIHFVPDTAIVKDNAPYKATEGSYPSGHTNTAYTDALLLGEMLPERFVPLVDRAARYGYSRMVLGVHYPIDLMGSRMVAQRNVAGYLNDAKYHALFDEARQQLRAALEKACGTSLAECAKPQGAGDPYTAPQMKAFYRYTMTYHLPQEKVKASPVVVPEGAEVLLEGPLPHLSAVQRRQLMVSTALPGGYPLSGNTPEQNFWQRLDLSAAVSAAHHGG